MYRPPGLTRSPVIGLKLPCKVVSSCHDPTCQTHIAPSPHNVVKTLVSTSKVEKTPACPRSLSTFRHVPTSQTSITGSGLEVINHLLSGLNRKVTTPAVCPRNSATFFHVLTSQTHAVLSPPVGTKHRP